MTPQTKTALAKCFDASLVGRIILSPVASNTNGAPAAKGKQASFNVVAGGQWFNQCIEQVPQSGWGTVVQSLVVNGQVVDRRDTGIMCNPYAPVPNIPAPN